MDSTSYIATKSVVILSSQVTTKLIISSTIRFSTIFRPARASRAEPVLMLEVPDKGMLKDIVIIDRYYGPSGRD